MSYTYQNKVYQDIFTLGKEMYLNSDEFAKELRKESLLSFIENEDKKKYEAIMRLSLQSNPDDVFVFKASYILNPFMSLRIKGRMFTTYQDLGKKMLYSAPNPDPLLLELVRYGLITEQMKNISFDQSHRRIYEKVLELEHLRDEDLIYSYFAIAYELSGMTCIIYNGVRYQDIFNLCYFLCKNTPDLDSLGANLSVSPLLRAYKDYNQDGTDIDTYLHLCQESDKNEQTLEDFLAKRKAKIS